MFVSIEEGEAPVRRGNPRYGAGLFNYLGITPSKETTTYTGSFPLSRPSSSRSVRNTGPIFVSALIGN
jgi:hypothetical protein